MTLDDCRCQRCGTTENLVQISDGEEYCQECLNDTLPVVDDGS